MEARSEDWSKILKEDYRQNRNSITPLQSGMETLICISECNLDIDVEHYGRILPEELCDALFKADIIPYFLFYAYSLMDFASNV
ncbi:hypothetical protein L1987_15419 [Smallanthus sonchifolius]|uniref:Uncharacterized protein n=1 Tax=Smallanthus sonchifolius TaxID=185202 RepID=A0ACB9J5F2_9ASTR|nr:hypothetical protein L1987_15419 [Smallanthus sonchifolius]